MFTREDKLDIVRGGSIPSTTEDNRSTTDSSEWDQAEDDRGMQPLTPQVSRVSRASNGLALSKTATSIGAPGTSPPEFEVDWEGDNDKGNPRNWPTWYKGIVVAMMSFSTWVVVLYSTSYTTGMEQMMVEFNVNSTPIVTLGVTVYLLGLAVGCVFLAPISETYGRKPVYVVCMFFFTLLIIPCGLAPSLTAVLVTRFFGALMGASMVANAPGTISDIVTEEYRALAFSVWSLGPLNGPVFGPVLGGFITQYLGFRFTNWVVMMCSGVAWVFVMIFKETYAPSILNKRAETKRKETGDSRWWSRYEQRLPMMELMKINLTRPFVLAVKEPICIFWNLYIATIYGILYLEFVAYPIVYRQIRGWSLSISGLAFLGIGIGTVSIIILEPLIRKMINSHKVDPATGKVYPEATVSIICIAAVLAPIGQIWFAWTCAPPVHWIWSILAGIPFGAGNTAIFIYCTSYLTGAYGIYTASALAGNTIVRSLIGGTLPLAGPAMYASLGPHWAGTVLGILQIVLIPIPFVFYRYGGKIRDKSALIRKLREDQERNEGTGGKQQNAEAGTDIEKGISEKVSGLEVQERPTGDHHSDDVKGRTSKEIGI